MSDDRLAGLVLIEGFLEPGICRQLRSRMDAGVVEPAGILGSETAVDEQVRRAASIEIDTASLSEVERRLDASRDEIARRAGVTLTDREGASFLRYPEGGRYLPHVDRAVSEAWPDAARRRLAVVVFLNAAFTGGQLHLIDEGVTVTPREGLLVAFDAGLLHAVAPVESGTRDVIVDWFY